jgi:glycine cleavage system H protein
MIPADLRYTKDHEWVRVDGDTATIGITEFAAQQLEAGKPVEQYATFGVVESVKAVSDLYAPLSGEVAESNAELSGKPELVNSDPYGAGWMIRVRVQSPDQVEGLLEPEAYERLTAEG